MKKYISLALFAALSITATAQVYVPPKPGITDTITLHWADVRPDVTFRVYIGSETGVYTDLVPVGAGERSVAIPDWDSALDFYAVITVVDAKGVQSLPTEEIVLRIVDTIEDYPMPTNIARAVRTKTTVSATVSTDSVELTPAITSSTTLKPRAEENILKLEK